MGSENVSAQDAEILEPSPAEENGPSRGIVNRRSFMRKGATLAGAAAVGASLMSKSFASEIKPTSTDKGDISTLRFLAAAEILETDLWTQYTELGGTQDNEDSGVNGGS